VKKAMLEYLRFEKSTDRNINIKNIEKGLFEPIVRNIPYARSHKIKSISTPNTDKYPRGEIRILDTIVNIIHEVMIFSIFFPSDANIL